MLLWDKVRDSNRQIVLWLRHPTPGILRLANAEPTSAWVTPSLIRLCLKRSAKDSSSLGSGSESPPPPREVWDPRAWGCMFILCGWWWWCCMWLIADMCACGWEAVEQTSVPGMPPMERPGVRCSSKSPSRPCVGWWWGWWWWEVSTDGWWRCPEDDVGVQVMLVMVVMVWYVASGLNGWLFWAMSTAASASALWSRVSSKPAKILPWSWIKEGKRKFQCL